MICHLKNTEIDKKKWDTCISLSPAGLVYADSWFLDIVSPGWEALIEDDYNSVFPLTQRSKAGFHYLYQPYFTQQLGLFCKEEKILPDKLTYFISAIPKKYKLIEIQLNISNIIHQMDGFKMFNRITHHLDLSGTIENIKKNYSENLLRNLKKAGKAGLEISNQADPEEIIQLFMHNRGIGISNFKTRDYDTLRVLLNAANERKLMNCRGIKNTSGKLIAGAIFIKSYHSHIFLFSATGDEAKESGAMSAIIDSFIREHSGERAYLDFEGSMDANLSRYYKSFGSKEIVYLQIRKNNLPILLRWIK